ncbi:MAG: cation:proton antiporter, partial [Pseudomonadota bacterium]|nr:cation:proton antiporter [Pseudomonadota bacterium]
LLGVLAVAVVAVAAFRRMQLPPVLGYLFVGLLVGPHALGLLAYSDATRLLGEVGVAFLLFTIGLEFSIPQFLAMRRTLLGLGGTQVLAGTLSGGFIAWALGATWQAALVVGGALAMSSTAIVVKQLTDQLELQAPHGRLALGILLFQDLAAVPFLVMIPILAGSGGGTPGLPLLLALVKAVAAFAVMLALGRWVLRPLFHQVAVLRSAELFTLTVLLVSLAAAWITSLLGLSLALGTFLAGMMLSETEYRHQIEADIRPFRDVLLGLFFITVGMQLDLRLLPPLWPWIALLVLGLVLGKGPLIVVLTRLAGHDSATALRTGAVLAHGGEFGFALLALALGTGLLDFNSSQPILAAVLVSMVVAPVLIRHNAALARVLLPRPQRPASGRRRGEIAAAVEAAQGHVILCGYGRTGQALAAFLESEGLAWVALDVEPARVKRAWESGRPVFYGDAARQEILHAAGLERAAALVISFNDLPDALKLLHAARPRRADLPILARCRDDSAGQRLYAAGATEVVAENQEAGLMLTVRLSLRLGVPLRRVARQLRRAWEARRDQ